MADNDKKAICRTATERYARWHEREQANTEAAYEDLDFCFNDAQWPEDVLKQRQEEKRPTLTNNRIPQFVHQVTGDMRQMKPGIKVVPVDNRGDKDTAETIAGMIRYVENRSDANAAYMAGADSQVAAGIGHWRVTKEYAADTTFNQELRIMGVHDGIAVAWDPDSELPTREDAKWCIVPVDMSIEAFKETYPDAPVEDFDEASEAKTLGWYDKDFVRVAEYWIKKPIKRTLALLPDGSIDDLTDEPESRLAELRQKFPRLRVEKRDGFKVCRYLVTAAHVLEGPIDWPGKYIPIIPCVGEEVRIGRRVVRRGLVRSAKDAQRMFNYFCSAQAEIVALQPKAPFIGTEKNFEKYATEWGEANTKAHPFLPYQPDQANGGVAPQRMPPPVSSQGITEGLMLAVENMKGVMGIYDAGLGQKSNETSGKAILARQHEGDIGTAHYVDNWTRAIRHTGAILIDLIPHVYDTERMIRIMGDDGKVDLKWINKPVGMAQTDDATGEVGGNKIENDVTIGAYDVVLEVGPSYSTKREEAKESIKEFMQAAPDTAMVMLDLYAKMQDWPLSDEVAKRYEAIAPDPVKKLIAQQKQEAGEEDKIMQPTPQEQQAQQAQQAAMQLDLEGKALANEKIKAEIAKIQNEASGQGDQQKLAIEAQKAQMDMAIKQQELAHKQRMAELDYQIKLADLDLKRAAGQQQLEQRQLETMMGAEQHRVSMEQGEQSHAAKLKQMQQAAKAKKPQPEARA
jgi:predicted NBD/HSP70 family sugar kinase